METKALSVLCDYTTGSTIIENEVVHALHSDPTSVGLNTIHIKFLFHTVNYLRHQHALGTADTLMSSYENTFAWKKCMDNGFNLSKLRPLRKSQLSSYLEKIVQEQSP